MASALQNEYTKLSWTIIEHKLIYYHPEKVHESWRMFYAISDAEFDAMQQRYLHLCERLGHANTVCHNVTEEQAMFLGSGMMEIDLSRPCVKLVLHKLSQPMK